MVNVDLSPMQRRRRDTCQGVNDFIMYLIRHAQPHPVPSICNCVRYMLILSGLTLVTALGSCRKSAPSPDVTRTLDLPAGSAEVIAAGNQFALNFFGTVLQTDNQANNKLISPLSINMALSMLYNGAKGATRDSIAMALQQAGIPIDQLNAVNAALIRQLPDEDSKVTMSIANSFWYQQNGPQPLPGYLDTIANDYNGYLKALDFGNSSAVNTINSWVAGKTNNKIPSIITSLSPATIMMLVNTIYFNGPWHFDVKAANTNNQPFTLANGSVKSVPTMDFESQLRVYKDPAYTMVELPYGAGGGFGMYVVLPSDAQQPIESLVRSLSLSDVNTAIAGLDSEYVGMLLPKWKLSYGIGDFIPNLQALGMGIAATPAADFSGMFSTPGYVSSAIHKTYIDVSEQGTEAAAATAIGTTSIAPNRPLIQVNHPFLYFIVEKQSGAVLFMGTLNDPTAAD